MNKIIPFLFTVHHPDLLKCIQVAPTGEAGLKDTLF